ncbi:MAG: hypothetical protein ACOC32_01550 [Nanoarchaeota archaeon]
MAAKKSSRSSSKKAPAKRASKSVQKTRSKTANPSPRMQSGVGFFIKNIEKFEHSIDFDILKGFLAAAVYALIALAISFVGFSMNKMYYTNLDFKPLWSKFLSPVAGQIPLSFFLSFGLVLFFIGFIYAFFYHMVRVSIHGHAPHKRGVKGLLYGIFLTFVVGIPMLLYHYLMLGVPNLLVVSWFAESVLTYLAGGVAIASIMK